MGSQHGPLHEGTVFERGQVKDTNLDSFTPLRISDVPEMDISFIDRTEVQVGHASRHLSSGLRPRCGSPLRRRAASFPSPCIADLSRQRERHDLMLVAGASVLYHYQHAPGGPAAAWSRADPHHLRPRRGGKVVMDAAYFDLTVPASDAARRNVSDDDAVLIGRLQEIVCPSDVLT